MSFLPEQISEGHLSNLTVFDGKDDR